MDSTHEVIYLLTFDPVQNLTAAVDTCKPFLTLKWDPPANVEDVTAYEIRYKPSNLQWISPYNTVNAPTTRLILARKSGLNSPVTYHFEVRARDADCEGQWSRFSMYNGMCY